MKWSGFTTASEEKWMAEGTVLVVTARLLETLEGPRGWGGVSFRGIDVSQYSPDAVDTPICNDPDAISAVARNCVTENAPRRILFSLFRPLDALPDESGRLRGRTSPWIWRSTNFFEYRKKNLRLFDISVT